MHLSLFSQSSRRGVLAVATALVLAAVACGGGDDDVASTADTTDEVPATVEEAFSVAYLSTGAANPWYAASFAEMQRVGEPLGITVVEFDGRFDPALQTTQMQDVVASGDFDGVIVSAVNGPGLIPDVEDAIAQGLQVIAMNQTLGTDLADIEPQVEGLAAAIQTPPAGGGTRLGELAVQACEGVEACDVVWLYGIKGRPLDEAIRGGFDSIVAAHDNITVIAEGEGGFAPDGGINAMQDILQAQPEFDVVVGFDQALQGVEIVLADEGALDRVHLIGLGGSDYAITAIDEGRWHSGVMGAPVLEGRLAIEAMHLALTEGTLTGGIDPLFGLPDNGLITADNVDSFEAEWVG